jgi:hypothetical protein
VPTFTQLSLAHLDRMIQSFPQEEERFPMVTRVGFCQAIYGFREVEFLHVWFVRGK